jgi:hypothetical protein
MEDSNNDSRSSTSSFSPSFFSSLTLTARPGLAYGEEEEKLEEEEGSILTVAARGRLLLLLVVGVVSAGA